MRRSISRWGSLLVFVGTAAVAGCSGSAAGTPTATRALTLPPLTTEQASAAAAGTPASTGISSTPSTQTATAVPPTATANAQPTRNPSAGYTDLPGWLVFEHFGQAPDGSIPTFDADNRMIWMIHADGTGLHELAPGTPATGKASPDMSPDGATVAFDSWADPIQIWTAPIDGGPPSLVSTDCDGHENSCIEGEPSYSADGKKLVFTRFWGEDELSNSAVGIRDLDSGRVTMIDSTKADLKIAYDSQPSLSPDGLWVVFHRTAQTPTQQRPTGASLFVAAIDGSTVTELPLPPGSNWAADPDWSPDGESIVFSTQPNREGEGWGDFPGHTGIWTVSPDGTDLRQVCDGCLASPAGPESGIAPSWTADGRILFWGFKSWALMNADGSDAAHINQAKLTWNGDGLGYNYAAFLQPTPSSARAADVHGGN